MAIDARHRMLLVGPALALALAVGAVGPKANGAGVQGQGAAIKPSYGGPGQPSECSSGCSAPKNHRPALGRLAFELLLERYAAEPAAGPGEALDALCFYSFAASEHWQAMADDSARELLGDEHRAVLERVLGTEQVTLDFRMVSLETGLERIRLGERAVPLGLKQHHYPNTTGDLHVPDMNGTVRRVGLRHFWIRL